MYIILKYHINCLSNFHCVKWIMVISLRKLPIFVWCIFLTFYQRYMKIQFFSEYLCHTWQKIASVLGLLMCYLKPLPLTAVLSSASSYVLMCLTYWQTQALMMYPICAWSNLFLFFISSVSLLTYFIMLRHKFLQYDELLMHQLFRPLAMFNPSNE